jgi:two-component sensor histidine kinase
MPGLPKPSVRTIRVRLMAALAVALLPVLLLGVIQAAIALHREGVSLHENLTFAARRSASTALARTEAAAVMLETLAPGSTGRQCSERLARVRARVPGYENLVRFGRDGGMICAAASTPVDTGHAAGEWFQRMVDGDNLVVVAQAGDYARVPAVLIAAPAKDEANRFDGALAAVISLASLQPSTVELPKGADVALVDELGRTISATDPHLLSGMPDDWRANAVKDGSLLWYAKGPGGERRVFSAAPLVGDDIFVVVSARSPGLLSWGWLNPASGVLLPLLTFVLALVAVTAVTERVVVRWIAYLQRIAALYARGRFSVRPVQAKKMPPEIRELAETLEDMADAIVGRDASLRDNLAQKDALMREIHHRVKNNLQVISSLLNMQQRALSDPAARAAMSDTRQRITALALIYRALYQGPDLKRVDLRPFLEELTAQLIAGEMLHGPPVRTELKVDALVIDPDRLAPLALFAVEAITNAQKHAFAERGGLLSLRFTVRGEEAELEISDDGDAPEGALVASGVGRTLMTAFGRQLRGRSELVRNAAGGITARLIFPTLAAEMPEPPASGNQAAA